MEKCLSVLVIQIMIQVIATPVPIALEGLALSVEEKGIRRLHISMLLHQHLGGCLHITTEEEVVAPIVVPWVATIITHALNVTDMDINRID